MDRVFRDLLNDLEAFEKTPTSLGYDLRLDLAEIILTQLDGNRWTQKKLAEAAGMKPSFISRIIHADANCTFEVAGRLLFALGLKARLEATRSVADSKAVTTQTVSTLAYAGNVVLTINQTVNQPGLVYGKEESTRRGSIPQSVAASTISA